jgi:hypothetical protein
MADGLFVRVVGIDEAQRYFATLADGARGIASLRLVAGSPVPYSYGIETGHDRSGRLRRRAGGAWMLRGGLAETREQIPTLIAAMLTHGTAAGKDTTDAIRRTLLGNVQRRTPVRTGRLRDSFIVRGLR